MSEVVICRALKSIIVLYRDEENNCIGFVFNGFYSRFFARRSKGNES